MAKRSGHPCAVGSAMEMARLGKEGWLGGSPPTLEPWQQLGASSSSADHITSSPLNATSPFNLVTLVGTCIHS